MSKSRRKSIAMGMFLILIGAAILAFRLIPSLQFAFNFTWPVIILLVALGMVVIGALTATADMLVPASVIGGIGAILYYQEAGVLTWESWAYLWTLIPGFGGLGVLLAGLFKWERKEIVDGLQTMLVSGVLFLIFGSLIGDILGYFPFGTYLPVLLIVLGVFLFIRALLNVRD